MSLYAFIFHIMLSIYEHTILCTLANTYISSPSSSIHKAMHASISTTNFKSSIIKTYAKCQNV